MSSFQEPRCGGIVDVRLRADMPAKNSRTFDRMAARMNHRLGHVKNDRTQTIYQYEKWATAPFVVKVYSRSRVRWTAFNILMLDQQSSS
jgi:hypothetical protein